MIDIHTHILPGIDDGLQSIGEALLVAEEAAAQGVSVMVATPHLRWGSQQELSALRIRQEVNDLNALMQAKGVPIQILPGCEIPLTADLPERLQRDEWMSLGDGRRAVLVEPPWEEWPPFGRTVLQELLDAGWNVVLAHPERYRFFQHRLELLEELGQMGVHLQVTTGSLIPGRASPPAARCAYELMERRLVSVVASDCHGVTSRRCDMGEAAELLRRTYGRHVAQMLTDRVPRALLRGERVELAHIWSNAPRDESRWRRLLRAILRRETDDG